MMIYASSIPSFGTLFFYNWWITQFCFLTLFQLSGWLIAPASFFFFTCSTVFALNHNNLTRVGFKEQIEVFLERVNFYILFHFISVLELQWRQAPPCSSLDTGRVAPLLFFPGVKSFNSDKSGQLNWLLFSPSGKSLN